VIETGKTVILTVPELATAPAATSLASTRSAAPGSEAPESPTYWTSRRIASASLATLGLAAAGTGGVLGLVAKANDDAARNETTHRNADSTSAVALGGTATVVVVAGAVVAGAGFVLWLTAPGAPVHVWAAPNAVLVGGSF
jgi:hypothetical protein